MKINEVICEDTDKRAMLVEYAGIQSFAEEYCKPYLNEIGGFKNAIFVHPLYRGIAGLNFKKNEYSTVIKVDQNRTPTDTPPAMQNEIDNWFEDKAGVRFRQTSLHCTGNIDTADSYSVDKGPLIVLPMGNFNYCWSTIYRDMFSSLANESITAGVVQGGTKQRLMLWTKDDIIKFMENGNYQANTGLVPAINSKKEIMISCKKALVVQQKFISNLVSK